MLVKVLQLRIFLFAYLLVCQLPFFLAAYLGVPGEGVCQLTGKNVYIKQKNEIMEILILLTFTSNTLLQIQFHFNHWSFF